MFIEHYRRRHFLIGLSAVPLIACSDSLNASPEQPFFRFVPGAYKGGLCFDKSQDSCEICKKACVWKYNGVIYAVDEPTTVCARCIADGSLARHFGSERFGFHDSDVDVPPPLWEEINHRTPGIPTFNPIEWPVIDGLPLAFMAAGEASDFPAGPDVDRAVAKAWSELGWDEAGASNYVLLFRQIDGPEYRAVIDFD